MDLSEPVHFEIIINDGESKEDLWTSVKDGLRASILSGTFDSKKIVITFKVGLETSQGKRRFTALVKRDFVGTVDGAPITSEKAEELCDKISGVAEYSRRIQGGTTGFSLRQYGF